jgi:hypothetical protein
MGDETGFEDICTLSPEELRERSLSLRRDLMPAVKHASRLAGDAGLALDFDTSLERRAQLDELVAFERQCCSGLDWNVTELAAGGALRLTITGLAPDAPLFETLGVGSDIRPDESERGPSVLSPKFV